MKNKLLLTGLLCIVAAVGVFTYFNNASKTIPKTIDSNIDLSIYKNGEDIFITPQDLKAKLGDKNLVILDGNLPKLYAKGHIPGAINIGFKGLSKSAGKPGDPEWGTILPKEELTEKLQSYGVTNDTLIVGYSDTFKGPGAGGRAVWQLRMAGLENVKLLYGGQNIWQSLGYELTKEVPKPVASSGLVLKDYNEDYRAKLAFLQNNIDKVTIIDVRSNKEFTGDDASHGEARAGHIEKAIWLEWTAFLNEDATPKSPEEITALLADVGITPDDDFVLY